MTGYRYKDFYCGVLNIDTLRPYFFLGNLNDLEVAATDVGNSYIHGFTKENIYIVEIPEFGEW